MEQCGREDSNLHGRYRPPGPEPGASAIPPLPLLYLLLYEIRGTRFNIKEPGDRNPNGGYAILSSEMFPAAGSGCFPFDDRDYSLFSTSG